MIKYGVLCVFLVVFILSSSIVDAQSEKTKSKSQKRQSKENLTEVFTDRKSGLMWTKDANLAGKKMTWYEAKEWIETINVSNHSDWRLPTIEELNNFVKQGKENPSKYLTGKGFSNVKDNFYWTSSVTDQDLAWSVDMSNGSKTDLYKDKNYNYVWPVRGNFHNSKENLYSEKIVPMGFAGKQKIRIHKSTGEAEVYDANKKWVPITINQNGEYVLQKGTQLFIEAPQ